MRYCYICGKHWHPDIFWPETYICSEECAKEQKIRYIEKIKAINDLDENKWKIPKK